MLVRILLADDHPVVRHGLKAFLDHQTGLRVVAEVADGPAAVEVASAGGVDVAIVDLSLPQLGGLDLVRVLRDVAPSVGIVVFTLQPEDALALHFIEAGACAYLSKDRPADDLVRAVRLAAMGRRYLTDTLQGLGARPPARPHDALSAREAQVFYLLLKGMAVADIALALEISASTASNHLASIRDKLGVGSNGEVLLYAHRAGLLG